MCARARVCVCVCVCVCMILSKASGPACWHLLPLCGGRGGAAKTAWERLPGLGFVTVIVFGMALVHATHM